MRTVLLLLISAFSILAAEDFTVLESGNSQNGRIETLLEEPLEIRVLDSGRNPVSGVPVEFEMDSDGGTLAYPFEGEDPVILEGDTVSGAFSTVLILTDSDGYAAISLRLGSITSNNKVKVRVLLPDGSDERIHFSALTYLKRLPVTGYLD
jgi:hypothetical protein